MRLRKQRAAPASPPQDTTKPAWQEFADSQERPTREDRAAGHEFFADAMLEPVPLPRWLRGRRRARRDRLS